VSTTCQHTLVTHEPNSGIINHRTGDRTDARSLSFRFQVENLGLTTAEDVAVGVIAHSLVEDEREELNQHLRLHLDIDQTPFSAYSGSHTKSS
jgi:hypothetical protein